ncbi:hypothetical protein J3R82DRAFT_977 [Butyriboletus roseoflavus]|nr:hypothetical protein J3R82DRAFT_977 [Butyriboletus roseoflavus]
MDSKNSSEALSAMDGLGFDDTTKLVYHLCLSEGNTDSPRARPKTGSSSQPAPRFYKHVLGQVELLLPGLNSTSHHFNRCITGTPGSRFARGEEACIVNCIDRFVDTSEYLLGQIQRQQQLQQAQKSSQ